MTHSCQRGYVLIGETSGQADPGPLLPSAPGEKQAPLRGGVLVSPAD